MYTLHYVQSYNLSQDVDYVDYSLVPCNRTQCTMSEEQFCLLKSQFLDTGRKNHSCISERTW